MIHLPYPGPNYAPLWINNGDAALAVGASLTLRIPPKLGMKRLRLTHFWWRTSGQFDFNLVESNIPGFEAAGLFGNGGEATMVPLFITCDAQQDYFIRITNQLAIPAIFSLFLQGYYDKFDNNYDWRGKKWQKYLMPDFDSAPFCLRIASTDFTFIAPDIGDVIRIYRLHGFISNFSMEGNGISHYEPFVNSFHGANEEDIPILGHLYPKQQYNVKCNQECTLYGFGVRW